MARRRSRDGRGTLYKDQTRGLWVGEIVVFGRRRRVYARVKSDARAKLDALIETPVPRPTLTLAELLEEWFERDVAGRDLAPSTLTRHRWAIEKIATTGGHLRVADIGVRDVENVLDAIWRHDNLGRSSLVKVRSTWSQAMTYAVDRDIAARNVVTSAKVPAKADRPVKRRALEPDDARRLLDTLSASGADGLLFALSLRLGLRPGEAAGLEWRDVDLEEHTLTVNRSRQLDERGRPQVVDELKVESARRTLGLPPDVTAALRHHRSDSGRLPTAGALMFPRSDGQVRHPVSDRKLLAALCDEAGVDRIRPNELRHSAASLMLDEGARIEQVADVLGHTSTRMVDSTYRHRLRPVIDTAAVHDWAQALEAN